MENRKVTHWSARLIAAVLAFVMVLMNIPAGVFAADTEPMAEETVETTVPETTAPAVDVAIEIPDSLDDLAWENYTYRDIFITNNKAYVDGFNNRSVGAFVQNTGTNVVTTDACWTGPYSLAAFGTPSQQIKSSESLGAAGDYFVASKVYCTRYSVGTLGVCLGSTSVGVQNVTDDFVTASGIVSAEASKNIFIGSIHSADLDGYVDDPVVVSMSIFENAPSEVQMTALYENYVALEKAIVREEVPFTEQEMLDAFMAYLNGKAVSIGLTNSEFTDPVGIANNTTAMDLLRLMAYAHANYAQLDGVWNSKSYTVSVSGQNARQQTVESTVIKPELENYYHILGGKTGTLSAYNARNLAVILEIPDSDDRLAVVALYADGQDVETYNRFEAARQIADAAMIKYNDSAADISAIDVCCGSAVACLIPAEGADLENLQILYAKNPDEQLVPASITKVLTAICALDVLTDMNTEVTYTDFDTQIGGFYGKDFNPGETVTFRDALYAMLLPSSNVTARAVARTVGGVILEEGTHIHSYEETVTKPTCTAEGYTTFTCECGDEVVGRFVPAQHTYEAVVTAPTCTEQGYTTHTCSVCGDSYVDSYVDAKGYSYDGISCTSCGEADPTFPDLSGKTLITLGDFSVAGVGTGALTASTTQLSQKTLIAVPYPGAELLITVRDGYQVCVYSGNNNNKITENSGWLGADGDNVSAYAYTLPETSIYMRVSIRKTDGSSMAAEDLALSGLTVSYESNSDVVEDNADVVDILQGAGLPVLIHISDIHGDIIRAERATQFAAAIGADALLASGDLTAYQPDDWGSALLDVFGAYDVNVLYGLGNHDVRDTSAGSYAETIYNAYYKDYPLTPDGQTYFYQDLADQKLRIISVNQVEGSVTTASGGTCFSQKQIDWLVNTLETTPEGYGVVLMYHSPETGLTGAVDAEHSDFFQLKSRFNEVTTSYSDYTGTLLADLVDAFMMRRTFSATYSEGDGSTPVTVNADFTQLASGVEFIAHVTGHVHSDSVCYLPGTACKQLVLGVTCTTAMYGADGGYPYLTDISDLNRTADTAAQDAFNAYIINREDGTVRVLRIGANVTTASTERADMTIPYSSPFAESECPFDTAGMVQIDLSETDWVNYGYQATGPDSSYLPDMRWTTSVTLDVPYDGVTFYIKINAPYELGIRSGKTETTLSTNGYWLTNKTSASGSNNKGYTYTIPEGHTKYLLSIANITRNGFNTSTLEKNFINELELELAGIEVWYKPLVGCDHTYTSTVTPPTCTEQGYTTHTCACGESFVDSYVDAAGHSFTDYVSNGDATANTDGTKTAKCDNCDEMDTVADVGSAAGMSALVPLYREIIVKPGQLDPNSDGEIIENEIYGYVAGYKLKKGHTLSISDTNYVFSVRVLKDGNYSTMLKQATTASYTATEDMTIGMLIRKPDKSALTAEELASIVLYDSQYGMIGVEGYAHRFNVEAETIDGGTATTRANIFLPKTYTEDGVPTKLIVMTNGRHGYLTDSVWNANTADDVGVMKHYMDNDYAVVVVNNTANKVNGADDWGNPQLIDSYWKAYEYVQANFNVEELFSIHSRSMGTFAAMRMMRERPELVKCALMCGAVLSLQTRFGINPAFMAERYGFDDTTGSTWEADKVVGYDPYTDVNGIEYSLPPTFWMLAEADATSAHLATIEKIKNHGNDVTQTLYTETDHSGVCRLNIEACRVDSLAFLEKHQTSAAEHRYCAWAVTREATCAEAGEMRRNCADCDHYETLALEAVGHVCAENEEVCTFCGIVLLDPLSQEIPMIKGQFSDSTGEWVDSSIYGCVIGYELKKGHTLSISDTNYVFAVRQLVGSNYNTMVKEANTDSFTATEDMTVAIRIRKPDKSALTAEELTSIVIYDSQYGMIGVEGYGQRFTVEAETIDGGTATTRANIFLPKTYSEDGAPTKLIVMTNGYSAHLTDSVWNKNTADNVGIIRNYLNAGYAVWVVDNTAARTSQTPDLGCPQLVSSYRKAYEYIQQHFNVEQEFSIHSRSFGTFAAMRLMQEIPELIKCAVMTGPRVSIKKEWPGLDKKHIANRFGFTDTTGATYEADKMVGYDPYTDVDRDSYALPPTYWAMSQGDATEEPMEVIEKLIAHGNDVTFVTHTGTDHTGVCTLNTEEMFAPALAFLNAHQTEETAEPMAMRYDDHLDMSGKTVEIVDAGKPTSYQVGYGVAEGTLDTAVVTLDGETLVATGIGTAKVRIDGTLYEVTVTAAPISLLLLIGQSNMQGSEGDENQSIVCPDGMVYATYGDRYTMTVNNATNFAPSALTGAGSALNVNGTTDSLEDWPVYLLNEAGVGKKGPDSGFAYEWVKQTGEKVWVVNAAHGGSAISTWQDGGANYEECVLLFKACQETLQKEIDAGHFTLSHMGYFWCQGCADYGKTAQWYVEKYLTMHENLKTELAFSEERTFEFGGIIPVRAGHEYYTSYRQGVYADTTTAKYHESFKDLRFTGPRVAQYWMINNPDLPDIWGVCNIGESWVTMPDGTDGVAEYFQSHYENGTVDYTTQVQQSASWYTPTTPAAVHDSIHYNQIGYNEVGREAVRNTLINLGEMVAPEVETSVRFLSWDGYTEVTEISAATAGSSATLVVPMVYPLWKAKEVTCSLSDGLSYNYYDLLAENAQITGTLTAGGKTVNVVKADPYAHFADHLSQLPEKLCRGVNLWNELEHDKYYYTNGTGWGVHSSGTVYSVTIPVEAGDQIYATSFGAAGTNGHSSTNGIRVTFFSEYGVAKTMAPSEVYPEFNENGGYLVAPEGAVAVNVAMWNNSDDNELYILNREHDTGSDICSICGKDSHTHAFSNWETVSLPAADALGIEQRKCACGETETREVEGVWQTMELSEHMNAMPESYCANTNLWPLLEHDAEFFSPSTQWHVHSSGTVYSVTIPVNPGEKIYASSFGKGGTHGGSTNGIRVTFFDAYGVAKTLAPADTYAEFTANGGYLIAPEGSIAVNIPMWTNDDAWELYILNREHDYSGTTCTICGAEHPEAADYSGKVISILGDSISTFAGYIPVADGFNLEHDSRYPQDNLLTDVNETWWMQVIAQLDAKLGINDSWRSTEVYNYIDEEVNSTYDGTKACMASTTRIQNLGSNGTPDVILFYGGTNDITQRRTIGTFDPATAPSEVDLTSVKWQTVADAYVAAIMRLQYYYPDAEIVAMLPTYTYKNTETVLEEYNSVFAAICEHYGVTYVDLRDCGITTADLPDGTHPDAEGMHYITNAVLDTLLSECEMAAGEHIVHSVIHELTGAESSLGYYKGVSNGKPFVTTITGEDVTVAVTMGSEDITESAYADGVVNIPNVTDNIVITAQGREKTIYEDHLQQLPEDICPGTNLWTVLEPENHYYTASGWGNLSNRLAWSVTISVNPGDQIFATSFRKNGENGNTSSSSNGIRVTWFDADGVLKSMSPAEVYEEFTINGYLTAPQDSVAVNIPMWNNSDDNELYILNREHDYSGTTCTICGSEHPEAADYSGKVISILGDSISTFAGYIPTADGFNLEHLARYPQDNLLTDVNETWWMQVIAELDGKLGINDSWRGATVSGAHAVTTGSTGENAAMHNLTRLQNLGSNGTPDVILFYGGTNDLAHVSKVGTFDPVTAPIQVDLTTKKWDNLADAYVQTLLRLKHYYPDAQIVAMLPTYTTSYYSDAKLAQANKVLAEICDHYGVAYVDLRDCGITTADLPDGIHPDATGMDYITSAVLEALLANCDVAAGENVVYSVSHDLSGVTASYGYYKGISAGKSFEETLTADNDITVTVTMGGEDITDSSYADGKISIPSVAGDLVIVAEAAFSLGERLQKLPENFCAGTNLWNLLNHDSEYYTVSGWGVHASGKVYSVTIPVAENDRLWATSFGKAGENGQASVNGIRVTFFGEKGVLKSLSADETCAAFTEQGYLQVPAGAVAVNIPMWTKDSSNELYILNRAHEYTSAVTAPTCTEQGYTTHTCSVCGDSYVDSYVDATGHEFGDWTVITEPSCTEQGEERRDCENCDHFETREVEATGHSYQEGICIHCREEEPTIPNGWNPVPITTTEVSEHLAYRIENGVLTFHDFGDPEAEDYGKMPTYTNTAVVETKYDITQWYQNRRQIGKVVFDETISFLGAYTLTNMDQITEIRIENPNAVVSRNLVLLSTTDREEALDIYAASTIQTTEMWIRGNLNRKLSAAVSDATMYYTDLESLVPELKALEDVLLAGGEVDAATLYHALVLLDQVPRNTYSISDYKCALPGAEEILDLLWEMSSGSCGEGLTYQLTAMEQEGKLNLHISGSGAMEAYADPSEVPWYGVEDCISDVTIGDGVTDISAGVLPEDAIYHVYLNSHAYGFAKENNLAIQLDTLRILCIGNSHTADYSEFRANILKDLKNAGLETEILISRSIIGSIGLFSGRNSNVNATYRSHLEAINNQAGAYSNLKNNRYDLIIVQDYMESVVDEPEVFAAGLASFVEAVKSIAAENGHGDPEIAWFADWVDIRTTGGDNALHDGNGDKIKLDVLSREEVYKKSLANIKRIESAIAQDAPNMPDFVIHASTIKQNAMSSYLGTTKIWDKNAYCILERDTTHMTYELGRYLMGAGVLAEVVTHYGDVLMSGHNGLDVGAALTVENGPNATGTGSQYDGAINEEILAIIREAISSPETFKQSRYVTDPVDTCIAQLCETEWDLDGAETEEAVLAAVQEQVEAAIGEKVDAFAVEMTEYVSVNQFTVTVRVHYGYSVQEAEITHHRCRYDMVVTAPTCTEQGYTTHTCTCGDSYVDSYVDATGHEFGEWTVTAEPSCTEKGVERRDCGNCDHFETREVEAAGHSYDEVVTVPTCTEQGYTTHTCANCGDSYVDTFVDALGHSFKDYVSNDDATCTVDGTKTAKCERCDETDTVRDAGTAKGHQFGDWAVTTEPTCTVKGEERRGCVNCDHFETREVAATGHDYEEVVTDPTCTEQGYTTHTCSVCGDSYVDSYVDATGHEFGNWTVTTESTCTEKGEERRDCENCDHFETREVEATGHSYDEVVTAPTCTKQGYTTHTCSKCGDSYMDSYVEAAGHKFGEWTVTTEPTCTEKGVEQRDCENCDHFETREVEATGHGYKAVITEPTCVDKGYTTYTCSICGDSYVDSYVGATGHSFSEWKVTTESTCTEKGVEQRDCTECDKSETREVDATGHDYKVVVTEPICTERGYTTHTCTCGDSYVDSYVDATGHSFGEWKVVDDDTRERICESCGDVDRMYRLTLPTNYAGLVYVESNPSGFYTGTRNVADVLGLKSGTFTNGEVTVTVDGTNITVSGTSAKNLYFDLQTGEFGTPDYKRDVGYSLPDGDYRFGLNGSGAQAPTVCIRYPDGSGNLMTASQSTGVHTVPDVSGADFGVPYLYFPKDTAYDYSGNLVLAMGSNAFYDNQISQVERIHGTGEFTIDGYLWTTDENVEVFGYPVSPAEKENQLVYTPGSKEYIQVYLPQEKGYLQIRMNLANSTSTNAYGWRLDMMYACDDNYNELFPITQSGEYEMAIKLKGRPDFMGMGAHGSERMTAFAIYVDGAEVTLEQLTALTRWESIRMVRHSDLYDPADETTVVARHKVEYHFDRTGLTVDQSVEWLVDETCAISYMMMFPVRRTYENLQITDTYFDNFDSSEYDVSQPDFKTYPANWTPGATKMTLYSEKSGVTATMESLRTSMLTGTGYKSCSNSASYNKLYFTICGGGGTEQTVTAGDVWSTSTRYEVAIKNGTDLNKPCIFGHKYESVIIAPTCLTGGYTTHTCSVCEDTYVDGEVDATGHDYKAVVTDPTCTEQGYTTHTCSVCSDSYVDSYVDATGHSFGEWTITTAPTCTEKGEERRDCGNCDHFETREVDAKGHSYTEKVTGPTCTEQGYTTHICGNCGDSYVDSYVDATGHSFGEWTITTAPTCTEKGEERRDCENCDHFETREVDATGHSYEETVTDPTCTEQGYTTHTCSVCGDGYIDSYVDATGHEFGDWAVTTESTCTAKGVERRDCENCDHSETREVAANGHSYDEAVTAPTCTEQGYTTHTCSVCGDSYVDSYVDAKGHEFGEWTITTAPTCTEKGEERRDCENCDHFETHEIEANGHSYEVVVTVPTCTDKGYTTHTCSVCGGSYVDSYVEAAGHSFGEWTITTAPTCTEKGEERRDCENCEHFETREVEAKGHSYEAVVTAPTCVDKGFTTHTCSVCGDSYVDSYVDALGHDFENGICGNCGEPEKKYLYGDIDLDGDVDVDDVLALLWYVLFPEEYPITAEADFDTNGNVDVDDVLALLWYVLFPDDYPLK